MIPLEISIDIHAFETSLQQSEIDLSMDTTN